MVDINDAIKVAAIYPLFLAGGLTPENVASVIARVKPFGVDVAGGVETNGVPDVQKIQTFIQNAKGTL